MTSPFLISLKMVSTLMLLPINQASTQEQFNWGQFMEMPPLHDQAQGDQILHFRSQNKPYSQNEESARFVSKYLSRARKAGSDAETLKIGSDSVVLMGAYLEVGMGWGKTINFLAALNPYEKIYGFDSFQGLPEDWVRYDKTFPKGTFAFKDASNFHPPVHHNVIVCKGWFKDSLPRFKSEVLKDTPIALLHVDCDIYSSTKEVFDSLGDNIVDGTIIVFDEFYNYPGCDQHEFKAFQEFLQKRDLDADYIAFNENHEQVVVKILSKEPSTPSINYLRKLEY